MTEYTDENDNGKEVSNEKLDSLISGPQASKKAVNIRKEDVQMIVSFLMPFFIFHLSYRRIRG